MTIDNGISTEQAENSILYNVRNFVNSLVMEPMVAEAIIRIRYESIINKLRSDALYKVVYEHPATIDRAVWDEYYRLLLNTHIAMNDW